MCSNEDCFRDDCDDNQKCCINIDLNKLLNKIWLTNKLFLDHENVTILSSLIFPKFYRWNDIHLCLYSKNLIYRDFKNFAFFLTHIRFHKVRIINYDGSDVMLDKILEMVPNVKSFEFNFKRDFSVINTATMKNICKLKNLQNLKSFVLIDIPEVTEIEDLSIFIKEHPDTKIWFTFNHEISEAYKIQLGKLIDTIIESQVPNRYVYYHGQNYEKNKILCDRYHFGEL